MLVPHSEPCSTTLRCLRPTTRAMCRRGYGGGFAVVQKPNTIQAAQPAEARAQS